MKAKFLRSGYDHATNRPFRFTPIVTVTVSWIGKPDATIVNYFTFVNIKMVFLYFKYFENFNKINVQLLNEDNQYVNSTVVKSASKFQKIHNFLENIRSKFSILIDSFQCFKFGSSECLSPPGSSFPEDRWERVGAFVLPVLRKRWFLHTRGRRCRRRPDKDGRWSLHQSGYFSSQRCKWIIYITFHQNKI